MRKRKIDFMDEKLYIRVAVYVGNYLNRQLSGFYYLDEINCCEWAPCLKNQFMVFLGNEKKFCKWNDKCTDFDAVRLIKWVFG